MAEQSSSKWRRFRRNPLAMTSVFVIGLLYFFSLCSELICNSAPLLLRAGGKTYFPFVQYVSEDDVWGNGIKTAPDYTRFQISNKTVRAVFAPVRFGPRDIANAADLDSYRRIHVSVKPEVRAGRIDVRDDFSIAKQTGAEIFTAESVTAGSSVTNLFAFPQEFADAVKLRFSNTKAQALSVTCLSGNGTETELSLLDYEPRPSAPRTVRIRLRDAKAVKAVPQSVTFKRVDELPVPTTASKKLLDSFPDEIRIAVQAVAESAVKTPEPVVTNVCSSTQNVTVSSTLESVTWPFRPVKGHPMGIDSAGRDVFARVLYGTRTAMTFGLLLVTWSLVIGIIAGAVQGYFGGWTDLAGQRFIEIWSALPFLYVMILVGSVFGRSFGLLLFCYGLFNWIGVSYYVRAEFLRLRKRPFVEAAKCQGLSSWRIIIHHILPNSLTPIITLLPFNLVGAIASISALDFLGFGLPPLTPSWGELLQQAQQDTSAWWLILYPSIMLFATMLFTVFIGEGLRNAFDPRPNSRYR